MDSYRTSPDGPGDVALLELLASAENSSEDAIIRATARIGRLVEVFDAIDAAQGLRVALRYSATAGGLTPIAAPMRSKSSFEYVDIERNGLVGRKLDGPTHCPRLQV